MSKSKHYSDKTFELRVRETVIRQVTVEAHDADAAKAAYKAGNIVDEMEIDTVDYDIESVKEVLG
jgi:predicted HicB family RNase H-like nuclease